MSILRRAAALLMVALVASGCWSRREINDLGIVTGLGVDLAESGRLEVTLAVAQPQSSGARQQDGQSPGGSGRKVILLREGDTIAEAIREAELTSPRRLVLHHTQVIVIGEKLAESGVDALLDFLHRSPEVRMNNRLLLIRDATPADLFATNPIMGTLQSLALRELESRRAGMLIRLKDFFIAQASGYQAALLPVVTLRPHPTVEEGAPQKEAELTGAAILKGNRLALYLSKEDTRGINWLRALARDAIVTVPCPDQPEKHVSARVTKAGYSIRPAWNGSRLSFTLRLGGRMVITDVQCQVNLTDLSELRRVEANLQSDIQERVMRVIKATQSIPADPFEFGEQVRARLPRLWDRVGGERWPETWAKTPVEIIAAVNVAGVELTTQPVSRQGR